MMMNPEHGETHTCGEILRSIKYKLILTLIERVVIEQFINEKT
jgi:hypothetical protein